MNTLSRAITAQILDADSYRALQKHWSALMNSDRKYELSAAHHILYLALMGKDWRRGFTPPTNRRKLENGAFHGWVLFRALERLHIKAYEQELLELFDGLVTPQMLQLIRSLLPKPNPYTYRPEQFAARAFPFDAYNSLEATLAAAPNKELANA
jgi:hypothetical protein